MRRLAFELQGVSAQTDADGADRVEELGDFAFARPPASRARRSRLLRRRVALAALVALLVVAGLTLRLAQGPATGRHEAIAPAPPPVWTLVDNAQPWFRVAESGLSITATSYEVRRRQTGGREDILVFGDARGAGPFVRLILYRRGTEAAPQSAFFVHLARRAAETGRAVAFAAQPTALSTRLGVFEAASLSLQGAGPEAACIGFRLAEPDAPASLSISGFACDGPKADGARLAARAELACLIDAIELLPRVEEEDLAAFFAKKELREATACASLFSGEGTGGQRPWTQ